MAAAELRPNSVDGQESRTFFRRVWFTIFCLVVFRLGVHVPCPGVNTRAIVSIAEQRGVGILKVLNTFSGGALEQFSVFALGVMPYISSSIIVQLLGVVLPNVEQWQKEGGSGRSKINSLTRYLAVFIALVQGFMLALGLESAGDTSFGPAVLVPGFSFKITAALLLTTGTCLVLWLGEQIAEKGIGNGVSIIIFAGIVAYIPKHIPALAEVSRGSGLFSLFLYLLVVVGLLFFIALLEQSFRKLPVHYSRGLKDRSVAGAVVGRASAVVQTSHLPLKVNMAGVIPSIFASTVLALPVTFFTSSVAGSSSAPVSEDIWSKFLRLLRLTLTDLVPFNWIYNSLFVLLVLFFCYFYTSVTFRADDIAENLNRQNAYVPGVRPGSETSRAISDVVRNITLAGALYMSLVILIPVFFAHVSAVQEFIFSGTSMLIVVGVSIELVRQIRVLLESRSYDDLFWG